MKLRFWQCPITQLRLPILSRAMFFNSVLLIAGTLVSFLFAEIVVRAAGLAPSVVPITKGRFRLSPNLKIGYEPIPNIQYDGESLHFFQYRGTSNRLGYRGPSYSEAKPSGIFRIVVLGDSVTEGIGIDEYEELFSAKIEHALREVGTKAQVLNFGVPGYNTQQEVETFKAKALKYQPDLVVLAYSLNDRKGPYPRMLTPLLKEANEQKHVHPRDILAERYLVKSALYRLLRFRLLAPSNEEKKGLTLREYETGDTVAEYANELSQLSKSHGFQVLVVVFPQFHDRSFETYSFHDEHRYIGEVAREHDLLLLDLLPVYAECARGAEKPLYRDELHPNSRGHTCAANAMTEFIRDTIIPDTASH